MAEKKRKAKPIRRTTKGKGANYRPTKQGAGMTEKGDQNLKLPSLVIQRKAVKLLKEESHIVLDL